jgi:hypothetical protein
MFGRRSFCDEQLPQTTAPQLRQWCRRENMVKALPQHSQLLADESGRHTAANCRPWFSYDAPAAAQSARTAASRDVSHSACHGAGDRTHK